MTYPTPGPPNRLGLFCLLFACIGIALAIPLHCFGLAVQVGGFYFLLGAAQGAMLAFVTRTRKPWLIYLGLGLAAALFWPLFEPFWLNAVFAIRAWHGAPDIVYNYFDILRIALFLLGIPYPYARWGQHGPDPLSESDIKE